MTREELARIREQLRDSPVQPEGDAQLAAESLNGWLEERRERLRLAVLLQVRGEAVPEYLAAELRDAAAAADARRAVLQKALPDISWLSFSAAKASWPHAIRGPT